MLEREAQKVDEEYVAELCRALLKLRTVKDLKLFLADLLSEAELADIPERWVIAQELSKEGVTQRAVMENLKCSAYKVGRVEKVFRQGKGGYRLVLLKSGRPQ